jgi:hypothetical protein
VLDSCFLNAPSPFWDNLLAQPREIRDAGEKVFFYFGCLYTSGLLLP